MKFFSLLNQYPFFKRYILFLLIIAVFQRPLRSMVAAIPAIPAAFQVIVGSGAAALFGYLAKKVGDWWEDRSRWNELRSLQQVYVGSTLARLDARSLTGLSMVIARELTRYTLKPEDFASVLTEALILEEFTQTGGRCLGGPCGPPPPPPVRVKAIPYESPVCISAGFERALTYHISPTQERYEHDKERLRRALYQASLAAPHRGRQKIVEIHNNPTASSDWRYGMRTAWVQPRYDDDFDDETLTAEEWEEIKSYFLKRYYSPSSNNNPYSELYDYVVPPKIDRQQQKERLYEYMFNFVNNRLPENTAISGSYQSSKDSIPAVAETTKNRNAPTKNIAGQIKEKKKRVKNFIGSAAYASRKPCPNPKKEARIKEGQRRSFEKSLIEWPSNSHTTTRAEKFKKVFQEYTFDKYITNTYAFGDQDCKRVLKECDVSLTMFQAVRLTGLQDIIYQEAVEVLEHIVFLRDRYLYESVYTLTHISACCALDGTQQAHINAFEKSLMLLDLAWTFADYGLALGEGVSQGVINGFQGLGQLGYGVVYHIVNPQEIPSTARTFSNAMYHLGCFVSSLTPEDVYNMAVHKWKTTPGRELVREAAQLLTEWYLPPSRVCKGLAVLGRVAQAELKVLEAGQKLSKWERIFKAPTASLLEETGSFLGARQKVQTFAQEIPLLKKVYDHAVENKDFLASLVVQEEKIDQFFEDIYQACKLSNAIRPSHLPCPIQSFWEPMLSGTIKSEKMLEHIESVFQKTIEIFREEEILANKILAEAQWNIPLLKSVAKAEGLIAEEMIAKNLPSFLNTKHILTPEVIIKKGMIVGFHLDRYGLLEKSKIIKFRNFEVLANGFYKGVPECFGKFKKNFSTFFPQEWTLEKVAQKVTELCLNPTKVTVEPSKVTIVGNTLEGFSMTGVFEKGVVSTCYLNYVK